MGNGTNIFSVNGSRIIVSKTLKEYDEMLTPFRFFRIHKSHLINLAYLARYYKRPYTDETNPQYLKGLHDFVRSQYSDMVDSLFRTI